jgi:hypothetical protein
MRNMPSERLGYSKNLLPWGKYYGVGITVGQPSNSTNLLDPSQQGCAVKERVNEYLLRT